MKNIIRLAVAGFGLVGRRHVEAIAASPDAELVAVVEPTQSGRDAAAGLGVAVFENLEACLDKRIADGIILATPNMLHVDQALACLDQAVPVLVEKPIAVRAQDAASIVERSRVLGVPVLVGHHRRHNPLIHAAKAVIEAGGLGTIRAFQAMCWLYKPDQYFDEAEWRRKPGAGPVAVNLVHDVDLMRYLCGEVRAVQAVARPALRGYENEDIASALLELHSGAVGTITVSDSIVAPWSWELTSRENPAYPPTPENCYLIGGSHGSLSLPELRVWRYEDGVRHWWSPLASTVGRHEVADPLVNQISHFAAVIRGEMPPLVSAEEGVRSLQVVEAIQRSTERGERIELG